MPDPDGPYAYLHSYREGDQHGLFARIPRESAFQTERDQEDILLDIDALAKTASGFFNIGQISHSPDHLHLAFSVDYHGAENFEIFIKPINGDIFSTGVKSSSGSLQWAADGKTLFWVEKDENQRPYAVFAKNVLTPEAQVKLIYKENDPGFFVSVDESDTGQYILINSHNHTTSEIWAIPSHSPDETPKCLSPRQSGHEYSFHDTETEASILSNRDGATNFQIFTAPISTPEFRHWAPLIPHDPAALIIGIETYQGHLCLLYTSPSPRDQRGSRMPSSA